MGIKTFKKVGSFEELERFIRLCVMDVSNKIIGFIEDKDIFPTQLVVSYRDNFDNLKQKSMRFPMVAWNDYARDKACFLERVIMHFRQIQARIIPARMIGCSVTNFKPIEALKKQQSG